MFKKIITQAPLTTLITLAEVKAQCRVFTTFEDSYLQSLILPNLELCQSYTCRMLTPGSVVVVSEECGTSLLLPYGEVSAVSKVITDGTETSDYTFDDVTQKVYVPSGFNTIRVEFTAGYQTLPTVVKQAALVMISTAYSNRDDYVVGQSVEKMPRTSRDLLDRVKLPWQ